MPRPKQEPRMDSEQAQAPDWLDRLVDKMYERMEEGERPALSFLLEEFLNEFMERERRRLLKDHEGEGEGEQANGFYSTPTLEAGGQGFQMPCWPTERLLPGSTGTGS